MTSPLLDEALRQGAELVALRGGRMDIDELRKPLDAKNVSKRQGPGGKQLSYIAGFYAIETANRVFGFDGWSHQIVKVEEWADRGVMATVRVTVKCADGTVVTREDVGWGQDEPEKAVKEAVTDALKRALRTFGDQFGNSLYDKDAPPPKAAPPEQPPTCPIHNIVMQKGRTGWGHVLEDKTACMGKAA